VSLASLTGLVVATLGGAAIGLERQWSGHASGPHARFGGIRTFTMLGGIAGLSGWLSVNDLRLPAVVLLAGSAALVAIGYAAAARSDIDGTTEVAALVVLTAGTLAGSGRLALASGVIAGTALLLLEKTRLHALVARIDDAALRASARFAALACIVLPLLPTGPYGPYGAVRPRELWALVLFFSGLSFAGWIARRLAGPHAGMILSGLLGGIISSTSVTLRFARDSRLAGAPGLGLAGGAVGACTVMLIRVAVACAVLNPPLAMALPRYIWPAFVIGLITLMVLWRANAEGPEEEMLVGSPLQLRTALQMTALFQGVLFLILAVQSRWGSQALAATAAFVGLTDLDALTLSLARSANVDTMVPDTAAALAVGVLSNTILKLGTALAIGRGRFRFVTTLALTAMASATAVALFVHWPQR
jgi:uncharacterized membrane protein (DUF4010 family)